MSMMKKAIVATILVSASLLSGSDVHAARVVVRKGRHATRVRVTVHPGFPIHRAFPEVVVRTTTVRVAPRVFLAPVAFAAVVSTRPAAQAWNASETLDRDEGWTEFTMNVDRRGNGLVLEIDRGKAQVNFAEIVFENGETQVVDFNEHVHATGVYSLLDFKDGRKVDHVRVVAKADTPESVIRLYLV
jgi:hypothetical protein